MKKLFQQRWPWFLMGMIFLPTLSFVRELFAPVTPKAAMPYTFVREEITQTFRGDNDYGYTLRSRGSKEEFDGFVKTMKMESYRISDERYEKMEGGRLRITISYVDGWITYEEIFT